MHCPYCHETIKDQALKCRYCGEWLNKKEKYKSQLKATGQESLDLAKKSYSAIFGDSIFDKPTDKNLFTVDKKLQIGGAYYIWDGKKYDYEGVTSLVSSVSSTTYNIVGHFSEGTIRIEHENPEGNVYVDSIGIIIKGKKTKRIRFASFFLQKYTFDARAKYIQKCLSQNGCFTIADEDGKNVIINSSKEIKQEKNTLNLETVFANDGFCFGTQSHEFDGFQTQKHEPTRIILANSEDKIFRKTIIKLIPDNEPRINFKPKSDFDVVVAILKWLGNPQVRLTKKSR